MAQQQREFLQAGGLKTFYAHPGTIAPRRLSREGICSFQTDAERRVAHFP